MSIDEFIYRQRYRGIEVFIRLIIIIIITIINI